MLMSIALLEISFLGPAMRGENQGARGTMALFLSTYENKVDKKGRVSVPASFRTAVATSHFTGVAIYRHIHLPCIEGSDISFLERLTERLYEGYDPVSFDELPTATSILAESNQLAFDSEGRILLSAAMKEHAGIDGQATFVGLGRMFQIWAPDRFAEHRLQQRGIVTDKARSQSSNGTEAGGRS